MEFDLDGDPIFKVLFDRVWPNFGSDRVLLPFLYRGLHSGHPGPGGVDDL